MIYARPSADVTLTRDLAAGLVGTLTVQVENLDGTTETPATVAGIVEVEAGVYVTTIEAPDTSGTYVVVWNDGTARHSEQLVVGYVSAPSVDWTPSVAEVAKHVRARTKDDAGNELGTFTADTRPTATDVGAVIAGAMDDVRAAFAAGEPPETSYDAARRAAALKAALTVELSYFPEQGQDVSPYLQLRSMADQAMTTLIAAAQARDMFAETVEA